MGRLLKQATGRCLPGLVLYRGTSGGAARVALTFDDGPHESHTEGILDVLAAGEAKATFFLLGSEAARHPRLVRAIHEAGHQVGNHGFGHRRASEVGHRAFVREALDTQALLEDTVGQALPRLYRPPYGEVSASAFLALVRRGFRFAFWSLDSEDSFIRDPGRLAGKVAAASVRPGEVLLFHEDCPHTLAGLPAIAAGLKARAFALVRIEELWPSGHAGQDRV
jgi:peptidoglycan/xylan/chitin deacetylase (PgdA/CDA1 family)